MKKTIAFILLLVAASLGFLHGASQFKKERERENEAAAARGAPKRTSGATAGATTKPKADVPDPAQGPTAGAAPKTPPAPAAPDTTEADLAAARASIAEGDAGIKRGEYAKAKAAHAAAAKRLSGVTSVAALPLAKLAQKGEARAEVLGALAATIQPNDFASGDGLHKLTLKAEAGKAGREYVARVLDVSGPSGSESISFRLASGVELALPTSELARPIEPCPKEEWRARVEKGFEERKEKADADNAFELFRLAAFALENGVPEHAAPVLERALDRDRQGLLAEYFCDPKARPSPQTVQLARGVSEAEVASAAGAPGPARPRAPEGASDGGDEPEPAPGGVVAAGDIRGNAEYKAALARLTEGIEHYKKSFRGNPQAEQELKAALAIFNEVGAVLEALKEKFPRSATLDDKILEVNQARVDCRKRAAVGG